jgi:hypothetical protein
MHYVVTLKSGRAFQIFASCRSSAINKVVKACNVTPRHIKSVERF